MRPLRVLLVSPGASWSTADVEAGVRYGLKQLGVEVIPYRLDQRLEWSHAWLNLMWRRKVKTEPALTKPNPADVVYHAGIGALEMALRHHVDVVFIVSGMLLHLDVVLMLKQAGRKVCVLFTESPYDLAHELRLAALVDGCWTHERTAVAAFQAVNPRAGYLPHAWHPEHHRVGDRLALKNIPAHDVVFVGSGFPERIAFFNGLDLSGIDLALYGNWKGLGLTKRLQRAVRSGPVTNQHAAALYRRAKIGLNLYRTFAGVGQPTVTTAESLSPRAYELAACGAFHLSQARAEVGEIFGDLVPTFETPVEAEALIWRWLTDPAGRAEIARQLPAAVAGRSWAERAQTIVTDLQQVIDIGRAA